MKGLYTKPISRLKELEALNRAINLELSNKNYNLEHHALSLDLVQTAGRFNKPYLFIAMKTHLRFSDVYSFDLKSAIRNNYFHVKQRKTGAVIRQRFILYDESVAKKFCNILNWNSYCNYNLLKSELKRKRISNFGSQDIKWNSLTHIFRHLDASFYFSRGYSLQYCSQILGHLAPDSISYYIHKEL